MKKLYEAPALEELILISEAIMTNSEDNDNEQDIEDLVGEIVMP